MGSVWRATQLGLDTPCAVKFLDGDLGLHPEMLARFEREAKAAAVLRSPHVVAIIDHALWDGIPFIAMELLDGENLGDRLARVGRMSVPDTLRILGEVCRALTKAHQLGIVHRDLKPDNIYIVKDDDREITKVLDFGIAKTANGIEGSKTRTGAMLGTPYYMSPEQAQGIRAVDFRADLWSMAVIAYQCVTGLLPFESEALGDLLMKLMVAPLPVPSEVAPVPPRFDAWWAKAASRDPANRFNSAKEFIDTLTEALHGVTHGSTLVEAGPANAVAPNARAQSGPSFGGGTQLLGKTPAPDVRPMQGTPQPHVSSVAGPAQPSNALGQFAATPNPISQTVSDASPSKKGVAVVGVIGAVLVLLAAGGVIAWRVGGGHSAAKHDTTASGATAPPPSAAVSAETPPTSATPAPSAAASASAAPATSDSPQPAATAGASGTTAGGAHAQGSSLQKGPGQLGGATARPAGTDKPKGTAPAPPPPGPTPATSSRRDFGF